MKMLCSINLADNLIKSMHGIPEKHEFIERIDLSDNKISQLSDINHLIELNILRELNLANNPIQQVDDYQLTILFKLPKLSVLDGERVEPADKVNAKNIFMPSCEYIAARDHMTNFLFNFIQDHQVKET